MKTSHLVRIAGSLGLYRLARGLTRDHPRILMYHRFSDTFHPEHTLTEAFEAQVAHIVRHHRVLSLGALIERLRAQRPVPPHTVVITVDDGYRDFHDLAFPILQHHGVPATLFVTTGFVDRELWLWPDRVRWVLDHATQAPERLVIGATPVARASDPWAEIVSLLLALPDAQKHQEIERLAETLGAEWPEQVPRAYEAVTWNQLRILQAAGIEVGGHTHTHPALPRVAPQHLSAEIRYCKQRLDHELGERPRPFCYPHGRPVDYSEAVRDQVERAGFSGAVLAYADGARHQDLYALRRHGSSTNAFQFQKAVSGLEWLGRCVRQRRSAR